VSGLGGLVEGFFSRKLERGSEDAIAIREHGRQTKTLDEVRRCAIREDAGKGQVRICVDRPRFAIEDRKGVVARAAFRRLSSILPVRCRAKSPLGRYALAAGWVEKASWAGEARATSANRV
jgi:hypothetical protein